MYTPTRRRAEQAEARRTRSAPSKGPGRAPARYAYALVGLLCLVLVGCAGRPERIGTPGAPLTLPELGPAIAETLFQGIPTADRRLAVGYFSFHGKEANELGEYVARSLPPAIKRIAPQIHIFSRRKLREAVQELRLQASALFDPSTAIRLGRFVGAEWLVVGDIDRVGSRYLVNITLLDLNTLEELGAVRFHFLLDDPSLEERLERSLVHNSDLAMPIEDFGVFGTDYFNRLLRAEFHLERGEYQRAAYEYETAVALAPGKSLGYLGRAATHLAQIRDLLVRGDRRLPISRRMATHRLLAEVKADFETARGLVGTADDPRERDAASEYLATLVQISRDVMRQMDPSR